MEGPSQQQGFFPGRRWSNHSRARSFGEFGREASHCVCFVPLTLLACTAVLVAEFAKNGEGVSPTAAPTEACYYKFALAEHVLCAASFTTNPLFGPSYETLLEMGAVLGDKVIDEGEKYRLIACMYLHGGAFHFLCNMMVLLQTGLELERAHGFVRVALVYCLAGLTGATASAAFNPHTGSVGASGAIFGLLGGCLGDVIQNWGLYRQPCRTLLGLVSSIAIQLLLGTMPMLDNFAHFFGFCMGFLLAMCIFIRDRVTSSGRLLSVKLHHRVIQLLAAAAAAGLLAAGLAVVYGEKDAKELCSWCDRISCQPFPWGCSPSKGTCWWDCPSEEKMPQRIDM